MENKKLGALFNYDEKPSIGEVVPMGIQHVIASVVGIVTPAIMVATVCDVSPGDKTLLIQMSLVFSGIATLVQLFRPFGIIGSRLPIVMGASFAYVPILTSIGGKFGLAAILGAQIFGGVAAILVGIFIKQIRVLFPPLVTGTVILSIGLSLYPVAIKYMAGGAGSPEFGSWKNWLVAIVTFACVLGFNYFAKGFLKLASILCGIVIGYVLSLALGLVDFASVSAAGLFEMPLPLHFGLEFHVEAIIIMVIMFVVNSVQAIGEFTACTVGAMDREPTNKELSTGIIGSGLTSIVASIFGGLPVATYGQNVGLITTTKVINKYVFVFSSCVVLIAGFIPKLSALLTTIPYSVIGGATISVFASISMIGLKMIASQPLTPRNTGVAGLALAFGVGIALSDGALAGFPVWVTTIFGKSEIILTTFMAVILNLIIPKDKPQSN